MRNIKKTTGISMGKERGKGYDFGGETGMQGKVQTGEIKGDQFKGHEKRGHAQSNSDPLAFSKSTVWGGPKQGLAKKRPGR